MANHLSFVPGIDFDLPVLAASFAGGPEFSPHFEPRLMLRDDRVMILAELLADACASIHPGSRAYGDGLALAISYNLFRSDRTMDRERSGLAPAQLRRAVFVHGAELAQGRLAEGSG